MQLKIYFQDQSILQNILKKTGVKAGYPTMV
jgi:hypothetical protein